MPPITKLRSLQINPGNLWVGDGDPDTAMGGGDVHIEGTLEVDGALNLDGAISVGAGLDIGATTTGINFSGDMTTGISMPTALSATDAILIAGANADAIHISGANTVAALHISGDQAIGILYDVDGSATDGIKFDIDTSMVLTRGIYFTGLGTATTALSIDVDGTTAISVGSVFSGVDMIVLNGTASGYGIEISGTCTTADLILQNGATINNGAAGSLTITEDSITLVAAGASKLIFGGITDWGTGATGTLIDGTGYDWVSQTVGRVNANLNSTAAAAAYHALSVTVTQTSSNSVFGTWTELYFSNSVSMAAADNAAAVWAQMEGGTTVSAPTTAGDFMTAVYANVKMGATFTTGASSVVNGVRVKGEISTTTISHAGRLAAFECLTASGDQPWDYGLYVADSTTGVYIAKGGGRAFQVGALSSAAQTGMTFVASTGIEAVSIYTDDGNAALTGGDPFIGIHSRSMFFVDQAGSTTALGVFGQQKYASGVDIGPARTAAVEAYNEFMTTNIVKDGGMVAGLSSQTEISAGNLTVNDGGILAGVHARLTGSSGTAVQDSGGILAGLYIDETIGTGAWGYGAYIAGATTAIYIDPTTCTSGIQIGEAANDATGGLSFATTAPVGFYFDDGGSAVAAWGECFTVGLVLPTASEGAAQSGFPCATHVYTVQRANITGPANANMCALNASYIVTNTSVLDGFDNWCVSAFNPNLNVDAGSEVADGTTLAAIAFSGNWPGTISGRIVPLCVSTSNQDWSAFLELKEAAGSGCVQDAAAGANEKHLKVYLNDTLYTITMLTA